VDLVIVDLCLFRIGFFDRVKPNTASIKLYEYRIVTYHGMTIMNCMSTFSNILTLV